jgi:hypothetical protein
MGYLEQMDELEFLGGEFATWLVVETARERGPAEWEDCQPSRIEVLGPLTLEGPGRGATQVSVRGDALLEAPEFRAALAEGKRVRKVKLAVTLEDEQWQGTLDAKTLEWRSVKVNVPTVPDVGEYAFMRVQAFERLARLLEEWVAAFLRVRMSEKRWESVIDGFRKFAGS